MLAVRDTDSLTKLKAFVVLNGTENDAQQVLEAFCRERLAGPRHPRAIELCRELPKTGQGKIDRRLLRERGLTGQAEEG